MTKGIAALNSSAIKFFLYKQFIVLDVKYVLTPQRTSRNVERRKLHYLRSWWIRIIQWSLALNKRKDRDETFICRLLLFDTGEKTQKNVSFLDTDNRTYHWGNKLHPFWTACLVPIYTYIHTLILLIGKVWLFLWTQ